MTDAAQSLESAPLSPTWERGRGWRGDPKSRAFVADEGSRHYIPQSSLVSRQGDHAPRTVAGLDLSDDCARCRVDDGNVVRRTIGGEEQLLIGRQGNAPGALEPQKTL